MGAGSFFSADSPLQSIMNCPWALCLDALVVGRGVELEVVDVHVVIGAKFQVGIHLFSQFSQEATYR